MIRSRRSPRLVAALAMAAGLALPALTASAQVGTAITYQGVLERSGQKVNSATDMRFTLFDAPTGGNTVGNQVTLDAQQVSNGLFNVALDFGVNPYTGDAGRWMQIEVRNPAGTGNFSPMGGRQKLTPSPFSLATRGLQVSDNGYVGIKGDARYWPLTVHTNANEFGMVHWNAGDNVAIGTYVNSMNAAIGAMGNSAATMKLFVNNHPLDEQGVMILPNGNTGIGTNDPNRLLHLKGLNPGIMFQDTADEAAPNGRWALDTEAFGLPGIALVRYPSEGVANMGRSIFVNTSGYLGVGASPTAKLHIQREEFPNLANGAVPFNQTMVVAAGEASIGLYSGSGGTFGAKYELKEVNASGAFINAWSMSRRTTGGGGVLNWSFGTNTDTNGNPIKLQLETNGTLSATGCIIGTNVACPSAARFKENVEVMHGALDSVMHLRGVTFDWKADEAKKRGFTHDIGFIAEEVQNVFPTVVLKDADGQVLGVDYARLSSVAVEAIKELKADNDAKQAKIDNLAARLEKLEALLGQNQ